MLSLEMNQESSGIVLVYVCVYEGCRHLVLELPIRDCAGSSNNLAKGAPS